MASLIESIVDRVRFLKDIQSEWSKSMGFISGEEGLQSCINNLCKKLTEIISQPDQINNRRIDIQKAISNCQKTTKILYPKLENLDKLITDMEKRRSCFQKFGCGDIKYKQNSLSNAFTHWAWIMANFQPNYTFDRDCDIQILTDQIDLLINDIQELDGRITKFITSFKAILKKIQEELDCHNENVDTLTDLFMNSFIDIWKITSPGKCINFNKEFKKILPQQPEGIDKQVLENIKNGEKLKNGLINLKKGLIYKLEPKLAKKIIVLCSGIILGFLNILFWCNFGAIFNISFPLTENQFAQFAGFYIFALIGFSLNLYLNSLNNIIEEKENTENRIKWIQLRYKEVTISFLTTSGVLLLIGSGIFPEMGVQTILMALIIGYFADDILRRILEKLRVLIEKNYTEILPTKS